MVKKVNFLLIHHYNIITLVKYNFIQFPYSSVKSTGFPI